MSLCLSEKNVTDFKINGVQSIIHHTWKVWKYGIIKIHPEGKKYFQSAPSKNKGLILIRQKYCSLERKLVFVFLFSVCMVSVAHFFVKKVLSGMECDNCLDTIFCSIELFQARASK